MLNPAAFRRLLICLANSRARPSAFRSSVIAVSSTTTQPASSPLPWPSTPAVSPLLKRSAQPWQVLTKLGPKDLQIWPNHFLHQTRDSLADFQSLYVELIANDGDQFVLLVKRVVIAVIRIEHDNCLWKGGPSFDARCGTRRATERDDAHRGAHAALEVVIDPLGADLRIGREVDRRRRGACGLTNEVLV